MTDQRIRHNIFSVKRRLPEIESKIYQYWISTIIIRVTEMN